MAVRQNRVMSNAAWPRWRLTLDASPDGTRRAEGGRRLDQSMPAISRSAEEPLVSYVTVVRNAAGTLERTLASVRAQQWPRVEHVVVDGLSDDATLAIIERHATQIDYYVSERDQGLYDALNKAIELASGDLICVLNADDWLTKDAATLAARAHVQAGPASARLVLTGARVEGARPGDHTVWLPHRIDAGAWLTGANVCHNGVYATRGAYECSGSYQPDLRIVADTKWLLDCADAGVDFQYVDLPTIHYSMGGLSGDTRRHTQESQRILRQRFPCLSDTEAWGLLHAFLQYRPHLAEFAASRPEHLGRFILHLAQTHIDEADLVRALVLAGFHALRHPDDAHPASRMTRSERRRNSLRKRWIALREFVSR
jgi:hypothetical protein